MRRDTVTSLWLAAAALVVHGRSVLGDFVRLDDDIYVTSNPYVSQGFNLEGVVRAFAGRYDWNWDPITWMSHTLDAQLYGLHPAGHHATNVLLHAINVVLLFRLLRRLTGRDWPSAGAAAVFAVHPVHVEVVAWISARKDLLSTCVGLLTMHAYAAYAARPGVRRYVLVPLLMVLGLLCKPMLVTLPLLLLLLDYWPLGRISLRGAPAPPGARGRAVPAVSLSRALGEKVPLFALSACSASITFVLQRNIGAMDPAAGIAPSARWGNAAVAYASYLAKTVWPADLGVLYVHPELAGGRPLGAREIAAAIVLLGLVTAGVVASRRRYALVGWLWFLGALVPVIGLVQVGGQSMADRYLYLPNMGLYVVVAWAAADLVRLGQARGRPARAVALSVGAIVLGLLAARSARQIRTWRNSVALFENALRINADNVVARFALGMVIEDQGNLDGAIAHYERVLAVKPDDADVHNQLGIALARRGRLDEAIRSLQRAVRLEPSQVKMRANLALALALAAQRARAAGQLDRANWLQDQAVKHAALADPELAEDLRRRAAARRGRAGR
ncbi:MAG: tetratricopeptide repeat protein [Deltaproteobacteria bacterium]|nr:tetratricopeptide repeat protein [Deltaproteobacteria bacterium]